MKTRPQWTAIQQQCFVLKVICPRCQRKSDVSHISLASAALFGNPSVSGPHPTSNLTELEGLWMDVEGCSGPTAINSSSARSSLSSWWNLPTTAACHTVQEGLQTNALSTSLLYCLACSQKLAQAESCEMHCKPCTSAGFHINRLCNRLQKKKGSSKPAQK